mmetsp:Transcript_13041/g.26585  ORF Transcript_13041/g.26585 Transcript_13041/m.26585 type:complete len:113 (-) Transcript_13041:1085-1423(-)
MGGRDTVESGDETKNGSKLLGLKKEDYEIVVLAGSAIGLSILYNLLQESMFTSDAKNYTALITMMTSLVYAVLALGEFYHEIHSNHKVTFSTIERCNNVTTCQLRHQQRIPS